jgi:hypothetical protein
MRKYMYQSVSDPVENSVNSPDPSSDSGLNLRPIPKFCLEARPNASLLSAVGEPMGETVSFLGSSMIAVLWSVAA